MVNLVEGVGINDRSYPATLSGKIVKEYSLWNNMLKRCYSISFHNTNPTYIGCSVSDNFKHYSYFYEWCRLQIGFSKVDYQLDKDLLLKGNKVYSENTCIFIPKTINALLTNCNAARGLLPIGVSKHGNNFKATCNVNSINKHLGTFDTPELAFEAYKTFKEAHIKELAEKYKDTIDTRAYQALINYEVHIDD